MQQFDFKETHIPGLIIVQPFYANDVRGGFVKDWSSAVFEKAGINHELKETFYTISHKGVIRALHFQRNKQQPKLMRCIHGKVIDCVVDLRPESPTFKQYKLFEMSGENLVEILVPGGCGHGYIVVEESIMSYKCAEAFYGEFDDGIMWNDPDLNIEWPLDLVGGVDNVILADKDKNLQSFAEFMSTYGGLK